MGSSVNKQHAIMGGEWHQIILLLDTSKTQSA